MIFWSKIRVTYRQRSSCKATLATARSEWIRRSTSVTFRRKTQRVWSLSACCLSKNKWVRHLRRRLQSDRVHLARIRRVVRRLKFRSGNWWITVSRCWSRLNQPQARMPPSPNCRSNTWCRHLQRSRTQGLYPSTSLWKSLCRRQCPINKRSRYATPRSNQLLPEISTRSHPNNR